MGMLITDGFGEYQLIITDGFGRTIISLPEFLAPFVDVDNIIANFIVNTRIVLVNNVSRTCLAKVYEHDVGLVDTFPSLAVSVAMVVLERKSLGLVNARFEATIVGELWYYHESVTKDTRKNQVMKCAWNICEVLHQNSSLNRWLSSTGSYVRACTWAVRKNFNAMMAAARITLVARYQTEMTIT